MSPEPRNSSSIETIRAALSTSPDPRVARSRAAIVNAVRSLSTRNRSEPITVKEIVQMAGVSRTTFYSHFASLDELGLLIFSDELISHDPTSSGNAADNKAPFTITAMVNSYVANRRLYQTVLISGFAYERSAAAVQIVASEIAETLAQDGSVAFESMDAESLTCTNVAGSLVSTLDAWLLGVFTLDSEQVTQYLIQLTPQPIRAVIGT